MKKIIIICILLLSNYVNANVRDGFYVGLGFDYASNNVESTWVYLPNNFTMENEGHGSSYFGNAFLGFGTTFPNAFFLAGELGGNFPGRNNKMQVRPVLALPGYVASSSVTTTDYITFDMLPGYSLIQNLLFYGRVGFSYGNLQLNQTQVGSLPKLEYSKNLWGGRFGAGLTFSLDNNFGLSLDYYYATYQNLDFYSHTFNTHYVSNANSNVVIASLLYRIM